MTFELKFELNKSDGVHCSQVLVASPGDLQYWREQAKRTGHLIALDKHVSLNYLGQDEMPFDLYQIFPPEQKEKFKDLKIV